jgi:Xaa-Pro aminopeptidase
MKKELDALMQDQKIDALFVCGMGFHNPAMAYLTGCAPLSQANLIKKCKKPPVLFHNPMERDEAAQSGLKLIGFNQYPIGKYLRLTGGSQTRATALQYKALLTDLGITKGRILLYGLDEIGSTLAIFNQLLKEMPGLQIVSDLEEDPIEMAMATKDQNELEHIRQMGRITVEVVANIADYLTSFKQKKEILVHENGSPVTVGEIKSRINLQLAERGAENPEGTIFSIGRDAGVPHSKGKPEDPLRLGQTIVFDFFPCEAGGGYFYDFTRTWCLGYASDEVHKIYDQVKQVYEQLLSEIKLHTPFAFYQQRACQLFTEMGHPTVLTHPGTENGYVHSLGHGVGLRIHEKPWSGANATESDALLPGSVMTLEPGLYYPERGLGVRLEDTLYMRPDGKAEIFAEYPMELVLPVKQ